MPTIHGNCDCTVTDPWHVSWIMRELVEGFETLAHLPPSVVILGSSGTRPGDAAYLAAVQTPHLLAQAGFGIITGGGPGIMEAANKGAQEGGNTSVGCTIELPLEERKHYCLNIWMRKATKATPCRLRRDGFHLHTGPRPDCGLVCR